MFCGFSLWKKKCIYTKKQGEKTGFKPVAQLRFKPRATLQPTAISTNRAKPQGIRAHLQTSQNYIANNLQPFETNKKKGTVG